jgi:hypothetical protein
LGHHDDKVPRWIKQNTLRQTSLNEGGRELQKLKGKKYKYKGINASCKLYFTLQPTMNFDQQNNPDYDNQQNTGIGQQQGGFGQAGFGDQQDITRLDQSQDTGYNNQGNTGIGSTLKSGDNQGFDSSMGNQDTSDQGMYNTQSSDTSGLAGGTRSGWDSGNQTSGTTTDYGSSGNQQLGSSNLGSSNLGSSGDNFGSGNQSYGGNTTSGGFSSSAQDPSMNQTSNYDSGLQGGQTQSAWDDPNARTDTSGSYNTDNNQQSGQASKGDQIKGGLKKLAGKLGNNPDRYQEGDRQQSGNY